MRYGSMARRHALARRGLHRTGITQTHHVIPRQFRHHPTVLRARYDVNESKNLILMPTPLGKLWLGSRVRADRLSHGFGHKEYNSYVKRMLDVIKTPQELDDFRMFLRYALRHAPHTVPWN